MKIAIEIDIKNKNKQTTFISTYTIHLLCILPYISTTLLIILIILFVYTKCWWKTILFIVILILSIIQMDLHDFTAHVYVKYHIYDWPIHMLFNPSFAYFL